MFASVAFSQKFQILHCANKHVSISRTEIIDSYDSSLWNIITSFWKSIFTKRDNFAHLNTFLNAFEGAILDAFLEIQDVTETC